jgi:hypothetical protein
MVDREARDKLAQQFRRFALGRVTNVELEEALPIRTKDHTLQEVADLLEFGYENVWGRPYRLTGKRAPSHEDLRVMARYAMFLYSDTEYPALKQPARVAVDTMKLIGSLAALPAILAAMFLWAFPIGPICRRIWPEKFITETEEDRVWPFKTQADLDAALRHPRLLAGSTR